MSQPAGLPPSNLQLVAFDISGTTVQATEHVSEAFVQAFQRFGIRVTEGDVSPVRGMGKPRAISEILSTLGADDDEEVVGSIHLAFKEILAALYRERGLTPIAGALETFRWLRSNGVKVALTTGFDRQTLELVLQILEWESGVVDAAICAEDVPEGRPAPDMVFRVMELTGVGDPGKVAVVGDTLSDLESGERAGAGWIIGVRSGAHTGEQLAARQPSVILDSVADLPAFFSQDAYLE